MGRILSHRRNAKLAGVCFLMSTGPVFGADFWWRGDLNTSWTGNASFLGAIIDTNFATSSGGTVDRFGFPGSGDVVRFATSNGENLITTLGQNFTIAGLTTESTLTASAVISGSTLGFNTGSTEIIANAPRTLLINSTINTNTTTLDIETANVSSVVALNSVFADLGAADRGVSKSGPGTLVMSAPHTYTGGTLVSGGLLRVNSSDSLGPGNLTLSTTGDLDSTVALDNATQSVANLQTTVLGIGRAEIQLNGTTLTVNQTAANRTFAGTLSGSGALIKSGTGTLTFTGDSTYSGGTTVSGGALRINASVTLPGGALTLRTSGSVDSTVIFSNAAQSISSLQTGSLGSGAASVVLNGTALTVDQSGNTTFTGTVTGTGSLVKAGSGVLTLQGDMNQTGGTRISAGTLRIGNGLNTGSISGNIVNHAALSFNRVNDFTYGGNISGTGTLTKLGGGVLTLTGVNTHEGVTTVSAGTLRIGNGGASGSVAGDLVNNAVVIFDRSGNLGFGGDISGSGQVVHDGSGVLTFSGGLSYTGDTRVTGGGKLVLNRSVSTTTGDVVLSSNGKIDFGAARSLVPVVVSRVDNLTAPSGSVATITSSVRSGVLQQGVLIVNTLSITGTGFLDLKNNDLIVRGQSVASVRSLVGAWWTAAAGLPGTRGLGSSEAFYTVAGALTTLAVYDNSVAGQTLPTFEGISVLPGDVLVKYTYLGDTNLDGVVDATDLARLLRGMRGQGSGWNFGDVNYDGVVNSVDLGRTMAALRGQGTPLGGSDLGGGGVIPEPTSFGILVAAFPLMGRRRR